MKAMYGTLLLVGLASLSACTSTKNTGASEALPCTCGEPETAFDGCLNSACVDGLGNPDNPDCLCGPLSIGEEE
jgi:hypothetical protein